jgi:hypothetical protein
LSFGRLQLLALVLPLVAIVIASAWWFGVGWMKPGADITERGHEELLYSALFGAMVELAAVPTAAIRLWKHPLLRTRGNIAATIAGIIPLPIAALVWLALLIAL